MGGTEQDWEETCAFYCHPVGHTGPDQGKTLMGTRLAIRPDQMETAYIFLRRCYYDGYHGGFVALDTGLGKTRVTLAAVATTRLVELNRHQVIQYRRALDEPAGANAAALRGLPRHNGPDNPGPCPSGNPFGVQCCCIAGSLAQKIANQLGRGPSICMVPPSIVRGWARQATDYLEPRLTAMPAGLDADGFVEVVVAYGPASTPASHRHVVADLVGDTAFQKNAKGERLANQRWDARKDLADPRFDYSEEEKIAALAQCHSLFIVSSNPTSLATIGKTAFGAKYRLVRRGYVRLADVDAEWAVAPRLVVLDEFHEVKGPDTTIHSLLKDLRARAWYRDQLKVMFLSATPVSVALRGIAAPVRAVVPESWDREDHPRYRYSYDYFATQLEPECNRLLRERSYNAQDAAGAAPWLARAYDFFAAVMTRRFAHELFRGRPVLNLPPLAEEQVPCRSPLASRDAFHAKVQALQRQWRADLATKRGDSLYGTYRYSAAFHHTLFLASLPGLVNLPGSLSQSVDWLLAANLRAADVGSWEAIRRHPGYAHIDTITSGSGKVDELRRILETARGDCSPPSDGGVAFPDIPAAGADPQQRPGLLVTTTGAYGVGVNGMQKASYGVVFDLPFSESSIKQAKGRIYRAGQKHRSHFYVLWSSDNEAEELIHQRHISREQAFGSILVASAPVPLQGAAGAL
ncbi:hypothetical protein GQ53DRAFT_184197 [Thozetella sp. PMI_491]|nr:hypothetical protein GQ53DRAFT_184197 [Thozetella sp. PMI_491]